MTIRIENESPCWCRRLLAELGAADERATALAGTVTRDQLNWTPQPGVWSIGQCLEHLALGNELYVTPISGSLTGRRRGVVQEITPGWISRWFIHKYIEPSATTGRARAPKKIEPAAEIELSILDRFLRSNRQIRQVIDRAADYDVNRLRFRNPFVPVIRFTVGTGLHILPAHQRHHLLQAERIRSSPDFPRAHDTTLGGQ